MHKIFPIVSATHDVLIGEEIEMSKSKNKSLFGALPIKVDLNETPVNPPMDDEQDLQVLPASADHNTRAAQFPSQSPSVRQTSAGEVPHATQQRAAAKSTEGVSGAERAAVLQFKPSVDRRSSRTSAAHRETWHH